MILEPPPSDFVTMFLNGLQLLISNKYFCKQAKTNIGYSQTRTLRTRWCILKTIQVEAIYRYNIAGARTFHSSAEDINMVD